MTFGSGGALPVTPVRVVTLSKASAKISAFSGALWGYRGVTGVTDLSYPMKLTYEGLELGGVRHRLYVGTAMAGSARRQLRRERSTRGSAGWASGLAHTGRSCRVIL